VQRLKKYCQKKVGVQAARMPYFLFFFLCASFILFGDIILITINLITINLITIKLIVINLITIKLMADEPSALQY